MWEWRMSMFSGLNILHTYRYSWCGPCTGYLQMWVVKYKISLLFIYNLYFDHVHCSTSDVMLPCRSIFIVVLLWYKFSTKNSKATPKHSLSTWITSLLPHIDFGRRKITKASNDKGRGHASTPPPPGCPRPPCRTGDVLGRRSSSVPAPQHQQEADRLAQVEVTPAGQRAIAGRVWQICDGDRRKIHEIFALRLHHLHHGDGRRRQRGPG